MDFRPGPILAHRGRNRCDRDLYRRQPFRAMHESDFTPLHMADRVRHQFETRLSTYCQARASIVESERPRPGTNLCGARFWKRKVPSHGLNRTVFRSRRRRSAGRNRLVAFPPLEKRGELHPPGRISSGRNLAGMPPFRLLTHAVPRSRRRLFRALLEQRRR